MANPNGDRAARVAATRKGLSLLTVLVLFAAVLRLVDAIPGILDGTGWQAPTILPCDARGRTATGWTCAQ